MSTLSSTLVKDRIKMFLSQETHRKMTSSCWCQIKPKIDGLSVHNCNRLIDNSNLILVYNTKVSHDETTPWMTHLLILYLGVITSCLCILSYTISVLLATSLHLYISFSLSCCWRGVRPTPCCSSCMACSKASVRAE